MEYFQKSMRMQTRQKKCNVRKPYYLAFIYFLFVANIGAHSVFNIIDDIIIYFHSKYLYNAEKYSTTLNCKYEC